MRSYAREEVHNGGMRCLAVLECDDLQSGHAQRWDEMHRRDEIQWWDETHNSG